MNKSKNKIVVFTGAGASAPSGLSTFRDSDGLWNNYRIEDVAMLSAWLKDTARVLEFYNVRRNELSLALPNKGHQAIADLQVQYEVMVVTQNVDDLHKRAGSRNIIHLHGELTKARSTIDASLVYQIGYKPIQLGDCCARGGQLRPHIVWFDEDDEVPFIEQAIPYFKTADKILVVGTSLRVEPAASLINHSNSNAEKVFVDININHCPSNYCLGFFLSAT